MRRALPQSARAPTPSPPDSAKIERENCARESCRARCRKARARADDGAPVRRSFFLISVLCVCFKRVLPSPHVLRLSQKSSATLQGQLCCFLFLHLLFLCLALYLAGGHDNNKALRAKRANRQRTCALPPRHLFIPSAPRRRKSRLSASLARDPRRSRFGRDFRASRAKDSTPCSPPKKAPRILSLSPQPPPKEKQTSKRDGDRAPPPR